MSAMNVEFFFSYLYWRDELSNGLCWLYLSGSSLTESQSTITFKSEPSSQTVKAGSLVTLACSASYGSETISYEWEYNSELLPLKDSRLSMAPDGTLQISKAMFEDQGIYRCKASRRNGDVSLSKPATLTVHCKYCLPWVKNVVMSAFQHVCRAFFLNFVFEVLRRFVSPQSSRVWICVEYLGFFCTLIRGNKRVES